MTHRSHVSDTAYGYSINATPDQVSTERSDFLPRLNTTYPMMPKKMAPTMYAGLGRTRPMASRVLSSSMQHRKLLASVPYSASG